MLNTALPDLEAYIHVTCLSHSANTIRECFLYELQLFLYNR